MFFLVMKFFWHIPRNTLALLIFAYQKTFSPDHGILMKGFFPDGYCKFNPSCSEYAILALKKYGVIWGGMKAIWRVLRCNPWSYGGRDDV